MLEIGFQNLCSVLAVISSHPFFCFRCCHPVSFSLLIPTTSIEAKRQSETSLSLASSLWMSYKHMYSVLSKSRLTVQWYFNLPSVYIRHIQLTHEQCGVKAARVGFQLTFRGHHKYTITLRIKVLQSLFFLYSIQCWLSEKFSLKNNFTSTFDLLCNWHH